MRGLLNPCGRAPDRPRRSRRRRIASPSEGAGSARPWWRAACSQSQEGSGQAGDGLTLRLLVHSGHAPKLEVDACMWGESGNARSAPGLSRVVEIGRGS
jgi:hypothetical protein